MTIIYFLLILVGLVVVHELGHFSAAKLFGIRVDEFAVGFPPRLFTIKWGETNYSFNLVLVGGYVSIFGENPDEAKGNPRALSSRARPVQAVVMVAGITFNILFAWLIVSGGYMVGLPSPIEHDGYGVVTNARPTILSVLPASPAEKVGIKANDIVEEVATGHETFDLRTLNTDRQAAGAHDFLVNHVDESIILTVLRNNVEKTFIVKAADNVVEGKKIIGVEIDDVGILRLPLWQALAEGGIVVKNMIVTEASALGGLAKGLFVGHADLSQVAGPIGIVSQGSQLVTQGWATIIFITALISVNLALINILPIPGLDGGRLLFLAIESIIRRPLSRRVATGLTLAGFALVLTLMLLVSVHDIAKLVG